MSLSATFKDFFERRVLTHGGAAAQRSGTRTAAGRANTPVFEVRQPPGRMSETALAAFTPGCPEQPAYPLPPLPVMAQEILRLDRESEVCGEQLAVLIERAPEVAALLLRWAQLPLSGHGCAHADTPRVAIEALGTAACDTALAFAAARAFQGPCEGPLGRYALWRHALYSAAVARILAEELPAELRPEPGLVYLSSLLHNCGFSLLGHLFQPEFYLLSKLVCARPKTQVTILEKHILCMGQAQRLVGMGHGQVGACLMQAWNIPEAARVAACEHHNEDYRGPYYVYANLMLITGRLLKRCGIGDAVDGELPPGVMAGLCVPQDRAVEALERVLVIAPRLDALARQAAS